MCASERSLISDTDTCMFALYNFVAFKVSLICYHVLVVIFPIPHDRGCEMKIIVIVVGPWMDQSFSDPAVELSTGHTSPSI